jgi:hypothetical protein
MRQLCVPPAFPERDKIILFPFSNKSFYHQRRCMDGKNTSVICNLAIVPNF